ncbi:uncharacterized protein LOC143043719 [Mytilus galloprovincialis]|uniref:uncharacterized protein LOC143043719 n=1 Tax=Mytilus galloprovincialis TaxID=29158 RepID=UPI003F7C25CE
MSSYCTSIYFIFIYLMLSLQHTSEAVYSFQCPTQSHWRHREAYCNSSVSYFCLYDRNNENLTEICRTKTDRDFEKPGYKLVVSGSKHGTLDGDLCEKNFYQPFPFNSSGNSRCVYQKSHCSEAGQVIYSNGTSKANIECRCDHMKGYDFLHRPKNLCFCVPFEEDCTCYLKICSSDDILSPDYECLKKNEWKVKFNCEPKNIIYDMDEISTSISTESHINQSVIKQWQKRKENFKEDKTTNMIPHDVYELQDREIIRMRKMHTHFEETEASKKVLIEVKTHGFVILSGPPGSVANFEVRENDSVSDLKGLSSM